MKKALIALLVITTLFSCGYSPMDNSKCIIVTEINQHDEVYSKYYGKGNWFIHWNYFTSYEYMFVDTTGKFQIGDTINFTKH